ncbi:hypothetical protein ATCC90586_005877 [Pythium insidiosum]|nr:hypothetical protein ATCC90586_005877 [Pythium insidiosum]
MATVPRDARLAREDDRRRRHNDDIDVMDGDEDVLYPLRPSATLSPRRARGGGSDGRPMKSFTTDDLPSDKRPLLPPKKGFSERILEGRLTLQNQLHHINSESVAKLSAVIVEKVKRSFSIDESERILREDWTILETEDQQLEELKEVIDNLDSAFQFSKSSALVNLATSTLRRCESLVERSVVHTEQCQLLFSQCSNEITTLHDYLAKLRDALEPPMAPRDKNEEKRITRRAEWAISRMTQSSQEMVSEMRENLDELDDMITQCTRLMVETITLLHMRFRSADFSGTGVAAGAATVVAGAMVSAAGLIAAPVTGGLSVPISVAGKGLFFTGLAALTPSTIMLNHLLPANGDADGKAPVTVPAEAVWAKGVPAVSTVSSTTTTMLPAAVARSKPSASTSTSGAQPPKSSKGVSLAFRPAALSRKAPSSAPTKTRGLSAFNAFQGQESGSVRQAQQAEEPPKPTAGLGFVAATSWTQVTVQHKENRQTAENVETEGAHFFQATYRDEYHPSRPNSYEAFCEERTAKQKLEQVKRDLERRQREQERVNKLEKEQLVKDISEGKTPSIALPAAAGRGRGMTMPAWMMKKMRFTIQCIYAERS